MLTYHFTNDLRIDKLEQNLKAIATHYKTGDWILQIDYKGAKKGWIPAYELYFGLYQGANNVELILEGKFVEIIAEFVKKFQFPNPRRITEVPVMERQVENGQLLAPLRQLVKLLFYKSLVEQTNEAIITQEEYQRYILFNNSVAKNQINIEQNYAQLVDGTLEDHEFEYEYYGVDESRVTTAPLAILGYLPFIEVARNQIKLNLENLSKEDKRLLLEIVAYNDFWHPINNVIKDNTEPYKQYMQVQNMEENVSPVNAVEFNLDSVYNLISYGAPGTGKSYSITKKIRENYPNFEDNASADSVNVFRTTLHPEYTYSDFVGQIMPTITDEGPTYKFTPGVFTLALQRAIELEESRQPIYLVLEELSRANVAAVFGDLFQLLDRENGKSEYSISNPLIAKYVYKFTDEDLERGRVNSKIYLPNNLYIYATVNTNDQNVFVMDTAFKRRFDWQYVSTKPVNGHNNPILSIVNSNNEKGFIHWHNLYQKLNEYITKTMNLGEDKQVGQFFIKFSSNDVKNKEKIQNKLLQYLWDDVERSSFNGAKLFKKDISNFADLYEKFEMDISIYSDEFMNTLNGYIEYNNLIAEEEAGTELEQETLDLLDEGSSEYENEE